jgi:hypothetical protein
MPKMTEAEAAAHNEAYLSRRGRDGWWPPELWRPRDQYWAAQRSWTGEVWYRPEGGNPLVQSQYNPLDALKDE